MSYVQLTSSDWKNHKLDNFPNKSRIFLKMEEFEWNVVHEGQLLDAMVGHKPVGINKYFQMAFIWDKLTENIKKDVQSARIWTHLETMYNLEALDESEALPFPNDEREFNLPDTEFAALKQKKDEKLLEEKKTQKGRETPKLLKEIKKEEPAAKTTPVRSLVKDRETPRRDSKEKETKEVGKVVPVKKEVAKKEIAEKPKVVKGRNSVQAVKEEAKNNRAKSEDSPRPVKRPTRGSLKPDEGSNGGKASPLTVTPGGTKRRRI